MDGRRRRLGSRRSGWRGRSAHGRRLGRRSDRTAVQKEIVETEGIAAYWDQFFAAEDVFYGHVLGFKGLERPAVVLCLNGFRDRQRAIDMLYVGMSRATTKLIVVGDLSIFDEVYDN